MYGAKPKDPLIAPHLERIAAALDHDGADPATVLAEVEAGLAGARAARAPGVRDRAIQKAAKALRVALEALRAAPTLENLVAMRAAAELHRKAHGLPPRAEPRRRFGFAAALEERPPPRSVCRKLEWEVGRPPMLIGPPGAGKTFVVQAAALDMICGRSLWGCPDFRVPICHVLHVDLDQGANKTLRRFKRLLRGFGVDATEEGAARAQLAARFEMDPRDLGTFDVDEGEGLRLMSLEGEEIDRWRAAWIAAARGYDVAFVDSLRRLAPFLDENDSRFSIVPDVLREVSEAAQVVIVLLHHASNKGVQRGPGPKPTAGTRGSSAIDGAAGTQLVIEEDGDARRVTQSRAGEAAKLAPFFLAFDDDPAPGPGGIRGLRVVYQTAEQAHAPEKEAKASRLRALADRILVHVRKLVAKQGHGIPGRKAIVTSVEGRDRDIYAAIDLLVDEGKLREGAELRDGKKIPRIWPADAQLPGG